MCCEKTTGSSDSTQVDVWLNGQTAGWLHFIKNYFGEMNNYPVAGRGISADKLPAVYVIFQTGFNSGSELYLLAASIPAIDPGPNYPCKRDAMKC
jgi:hypothetical protein